MGAFTESDAYLIARHLQGDERAAGLLFARHELELKLCLFQWRGNRNFEDFVQEALLHLFKRLDRWDPAVRDFPTWAKTVLHNKCRSEYRRLMGQSGRIKKIDVPIESLPSPQEAEDIDLLEQLHPRFLRPEVVDRIRHFLEILPQGQASWLLKQPEGLDKTLLKRLSRTRERVARELDIRSTGCRRSFWVGRHLAIAAVTGYLPMETFR
jgi:RNA polymerase sigma factor (sigma-70 family)